MVPYHHASHNVSRYTFCLVLSAPVLTRKNKNKQTTKKQGEKLFLVPDRNFKCLHGYRSFSVQARLVWEQPFCSHRQCRSRFLFRYLSLTHVMCNRGIRRHRNALIFWFFKLLLCAVNRVAEPKWGWERGGRGGERRGPTWTGRQLSAVNGVVILGGVGCLAQRWSDA